ncbi:MAG TPA: 5-(carboxyamino)imidazole ribonucleotide synthase [Methylomirabilota bacterium]|nr:5-(carboxyamino)imidazole ribonucleotide synthase [Methylomirabilota bacterium]
MTRVLPGGTIGILGGGQLARMLAIEGRRMGYRIAILDQQPQGPAAQLADVHIAGAFDDVDAAERLAHDSDVLTLDTEHVPAEILERLEAVKPVRPAARILRIVQDRLEQRRFLDALGAPQVRYAPVTAEAESLRAAALLEFPAVLKTRRSGYDGKGQVRVADPRDLADALQNLGRVPSILETLVDFDKEISVLLARDLDGNVRFYSIAENVHRRHVLRMSRVPARISPQMSAEAEGLGAHIASALGHVGMLAIELFVTQQGGLLVNEIAPRTHNSGHYSFGACATSQFEQHIRAVCGLPLGDPSLLRPAVMLNLLGDLWAKGSPDWTPVLSQPAAHLHLYGKERASPGRKMGHILVLGDDVEQAGALAETIEAALERSVSTCEVRHGAGRG